MDGSASPRRYTIDFVRNHYNLLPINLDINCVHASYHKCPIPKPYLNSHTWGPVVRDYCKLAYITHGRGILTVNGVDHHLHAGQVFVNFPGTIITEYTERPDPWGYYCLFVKSSCLPKHLRSLGFSELVPSIGGDDMGEFAPLFSEAIDIQENPGIDYIFRQTMCVCKIICALAKYAEPSAEEKKPSSNTYIEKALQYFEMHYPRKISISDVSDALGLDRSHFSRMFKQHMDISPQEYLMRLRIQKACEFLMVPNATITSVAHSVGYDPFAFSRVFKQIMGVSPSEYQSQR